MSMVIKKKTIMIDKRFIICHVHSPKLFFVLFIISFYCCLMQWGELYLKGVNGGDNSK